MPPPSPPGRRGTLRCRRNICASRRPAPRFGISSEARMARPHPGPLPRGEGVAGAGAGRDSRRSSQPPTFRSARAGTSAAHAAQRRPKPAHDSPSPGGEGRGEGERPSNSFPRFPAAFAEHSAPHRPKPAHDSPSPGGEGRGEGERSSKGLRRFPAPRVHPTTFSASLRPPLLCILVQLLHGLIEAILDVVIGLVRVGFLV